MEKVLLEAKLIAFHPKTSFTIICKGRVVSIGFKEITHVSKKGIVTVIYTQSNSYRTYHSLQEIMNEVPVNDFFRIHRSHIISLRHTKSVRSNKVIIGEYILPVTGYYRIQLGRRFQAILDEAYEFYHLR